MESNKSIKNIKKSKKQNLYSEINNIANKLLEFSEQVPPDLEKWELYSFDNYFQSFDLIIIKGWIESCGLLDAARCFIEDIEIFKKRYKEWFNIIGKNGISKIEEIFELETTDEFTFVMIKEEYDEICEFAKNLSIWLNKLVQFIKAKLNGKKCLTL